MSVTLLSLLCMSGGNRRERANYIFDFVLSGQYRKILEKSTLNDFFSQFLSSSFQSHPFFLQSHPLFLTISSLFLPISSLFLPISSPFSSNLIPFFFQSHPFYLPISSHFLPISSLFLRCGGGQITLIRHVK